MPTLYKLINALCCSSCSRQQRCLYLQSTSSHFLLICDPALESSAPAHDGVSWNAEKPSSFSLREREAVIAWTCLMTSSFVNTYMSQMPVAVALLGFSQKGATGAILSCTLQKACHQQRALERLAHLGWISRKMIKPLRYDDRNNIPVLD